ncbi:MAG: hypothetical protein RJQ02_00380 [Hyphomonas sp.]
MKNSTSRKTSAVACEVQRRFCNVINVTGALYRQVLEDEIDVDVCILRHIPFGFDRANGNRVRGDFMDPELLGDRLGQAMHARLRCSLKPPSFPSGDTKEGVSLNCTYLQSHFVYYWLTRTEPIPEGERDIAHALGNRRLEYFNEQVNGKVLAKE